MALPVKVSINGRLWDRLYFRGSITNIFEKIIRTPVRTES